MGDKVVTSIVSILTAIIGVAIIAVLVSNKSQTATVLSSGGSVFSQILGTAISGGTATGLSGL